MSRSGTFFLGCALLGSHRTIHVDTLSPSSSIPQSMGANRYGTTRPSPPSRIMKKYGAPGSIVTDGLRAYSAAMNEIGVAERHEVGGRLNNRAENSHQPFRRRERAMQRFRSMKTLQKFSSVHSQVHNQFSQERHLVTRQVALLPWLSGALSRRRLPLARWRSRGISTSLVTLTAPARLLSRRPTGTVRAIFRALSGRGSFGP